MSAVDTGPLPDPDHAARRDRLRVVLAADEVDRLLVTGPANVRYLSGFSGSAGQVIVGPDPGDDRLCTDDRYLGRAAVEAPDLPVVCTRDALGVLLDGHPGDVAVPAVRRIGLEAEKVSWAAARRAGQRAAAVDAILTPTQGHVEALREVKDDAEVARIARACALTQAALAWLLAEVVAVGRRERELAVALERRFVDLGADDIAFPSIVASGPHSAVPHHAPTDRPLAAGDLLTIDCGAVVDGYHADLTRTVALHHLDVQLTEVHAVVVAAQAAGRAAAVAGARAGDVDAAARQVITDAGYGAAFVHGTGHGVGLEIHEAPAVARKGSATLRAGVTLTVEPGVYLPGTGGVRIEDTAVVTDGPVRPLTDLPRELVLLGR